MKVHDLHKYGTHSEMVRILTQPHHRSTGFKVAHNTDAMYSRESGCVHVWFHVTEIAVLYPDGSVKLDSGGWRTPATKVRLNAFIPQRFTVYQDKGNWWVMCSENVTLSDGTVGKRYGKIPFYDGMTFFEDGTVAHKEFGRVDPLTV